MTQSAARPDRPLWIAVDGPSGSGKSSAARGLAARLGWAYLDTGATYRAATIAALEAGVDVAAIVPTDPDGSASSAAAGAAVLAAFHACGMRSTTDPQAPGIYLGQRSVEVEIRSPEATQWVGAVASVPALRRELVAYQRQIALDHASSGIVLEGRDIGGVVLPDAPLRIYLTASAEARARRRAADPAALAAGTAASLEATKADLARRDTIDASRAEDPAGIAPGSRVVDSSDLDLAGTIDVLLSMYREVFPNEPEEA